VAVLLVEACQHTHSAVSHSTFNKHTLQETQLSITRTSKYGTSSQASSPAYAAMTTFIVSRHGRARKQQACINSSPLMASTGSNHYRTDSIFM